MRHPLEVRRAIVDTYSKILAAIEEVPGEVGRLKWVGIYPQKQGGDAAFIDWVEGLEAWSQVCEKLETRPLDKPQALDKLNALDKRVAFGSLKRAFDPDAPLFIDYEEHLGNYVGTDRAPVEHEAVRY